MIPVVVAVPAGTAAVVPPVVVAAAPVVFCAGVWTGWAGVAVVVRCSLEEKHPIVGEVEFSRTADGVRA